MAFIFILILLEVTLPEIGAAIGIFSSVIIAVTFLAGFTWWIWKGKDAQQCEKDLARANARLEEYKEETERALRHKTDAELEKSKAETARVKLESQLSDTESELQRCRNREGRIDDAWKQKEENWEKLKMRMLGEIQLRGGDIEQFKN